MSMDEAGSGKPLEYTEPKPSKPRTIKGHPAKVRKHLVTTAYKNDAADKLDKLYAAGHTVLAITASSDVRGFEIVSYNEE